MPEAEFTSVVLMSLPPSWDSFISMINGEDLESMDPEVSKKAADSILSQFQSEAMHQKSQHNSSGPSAFNSQKSMSYSKGRPDKTTTECNYCHKKGHWARECRKYLADEKRKNPNTATQKGKGELASIFSSSNSKSRNNWIGDMGAEYHIIHDCNSFTEYNTLSGEHIKAWVASRPQSMDPGLSPLQ